VGGESHRDYLVKLGMSAERIRFGYNVVDNDFFEAGAEKWKVQSSPVRCREYFLASNRFIERKNLSRLIEAYANSLHLDFPVWDLCLLGDGELKAKLIKQCQGLGLEVAECEPWEVSRGEGPRVFFPGFQQIEELPRFYAQAGCFVHPALEEPWGLVINEAMACGLPILSGSNVGAAEELVDDKVNGWVFEATELDAMSQRLRKITGMEITERLKMGQESTRILKDRAATESFGKGLAELVGETS